MKHVQHTLIVLGLCLIVCFGESTTIAQTADKLTAANETIAGQPTSKSEAKHSVTNLLLNSSMEYWHPSGLCPQGWGTWTPDPLRQTWSVHRNHEFVRDGQSSWQINTNSWANAYSSAKVEAGKTYTFSIYVRVDKPVKLTLTLNIGGKDVQASQRAAERVKNVFELKPGQWQRVSVTDTMPPGATSATTYLFLRGQGQWLFDKAMLNEGQLADYVAGKHYQPIVPLGRVKQTGETAFMPAYWNADNQEVDDQEVAYCFDSDIMSLYRLHENNAAIGGRFEQPVRLRGLTLLLHEASLPDDVTLTLQIKHDDQWQDYDFNPVAVGTSTLLAFEPVEMQAFRLRFGFTHNPQANAAEGKKTLRKLLRIYHIGLAQ